MVGLGGMTRDGRDETERVDLYGAMASGRTAHGRTCQEKQPWSVLCVFTLLLPSPANQMACIGSGHLYWVPAGWSRPGTWSLFPPLHLTQPGFAVRPSPPPSLSRILSPASTDYQTHPEFSPLDPNGLSSSSSTSSPPNSLLLFFTSLSTLHKGQFLVCLLRYCLPASESPEGRRLFDAHSPALSRTPLFRASTDSGPVNLDPNLSALCIRANSERQSRPQPSQTNSHCRYSGLFDISPSCPYPALFAAQTLNQPCLPLL